MKHLLFLIILFASCSKEVNNPLKPPARSFSTVDIFARFYPTSHPFVKGNTYGIEYTLSHTLLVGTLISVKWKDGIETHTLTTPIIAGQSSGRSETMLPIINGPKDLQLVKVDGDSTIVYRLKQTP